MSDNLLDLTQFQLSRPERLSWIYPTSAKDPLTQLRSQSLRKFLARAETYLTANQITWAIEPLELTQFEAWLPYYRAKMAEKGFDCLANTSWFLKRQSQGDQLLGLWFRRQQQLVASGIIRVKADKIVLAFKASDRLDLAGRSNSSIGAVVDHFFQKYALEHQFASISSGRSRNAFGVLNSLGYLDFKLKLGYVPQADLASPVSQTVPTDAQGRVLFFGLSGTVLSGSSNWYEINPSAEPWSKRLVTNLAPEILCWE
ncbi:MAG TPA: hypothetical protein DEP87_04530 [Candidatus Pacebacteria bacterium]|nr:hypothetical protein [Candidatus Paceibacterota bacterium]